MKKLLSFLSTIGITIPAITTVIACGDPTPEQRVGQELKQATIQNQDIGNFIIEPTEAEILARIKELNPELEIQEIEIVQNQNNSVTIKVITNSTVYEQATFTINYTVHDDRLQLSDLIQIPHLGIIELQTDLPTEEQLLTALFLKNTVNKAELEISDITSTSATVKVKANSKVYKPGSVGLTYTTTKLDTRAHLNDVITEKNLETIDVHGLEPNAEQIIKALKNKNPKLVENEIRVESITETEATIRVNKTDSTFYKPGTVKIKYKVKDIRPVLADHIKQTDLGEFNSVLEVPTSEEILVVVKQTAGNENLNGQEVEVSDITTTSAVIKVKTDSKIYKQGSINLTYTSTKLDTRLELSEIISKTELGSIDVIGTEVNAEQIVQAIISHEENDLLKTSEVEVSDITATSAVIKVIEDSIIYKPGTISVEYTINDIRQTLNDVINDTNIGTVDAKGKIPTVNDILVNIPNLDKNEISIDQINEISAIIKVNENSMVYKPGQISVTYTVNDTRLLLSTIIEESHLGEFLPNVTDQDLLNHFGKLNPEIDLTQLKIMGNNNNDELTIETLISSKIYQEERITLTYVINRRVQLTSVIQETDLGIFLEQPTNEEILNRFEELNPELEIDELEVSLNENNQATISVKEGSLVYYQDEIQLTYSLDQRLILADHIKEPFLGIFNSVSDEQAILNKIQELNSELQVNEIEIENVDVENNQITINAKENSTVYKPSTYIFQATLLNTRYVTSFIDSNGETDYIYQSKDDYVNNNHKPGKDSWQYSPIITFATIQLKNYNYESVEAFFNDYTIEFKYDWIGNVWISSSSGDANAGWWYKGGKHIAQKDWVMKDQIQNWTNKTQINKIDKTLGSLTGTYQSQAKISSWMEIDENNLTITIKGQSSAIYTWGWLSTSHFAAYATMQAKDIKITPKK